MKEIFVLLSPFFWSAKNDITRLSRSFYKKILFYTVTSSLFIFLITKLLNLGMAKLQSFSAEVFQILLVKGYSLIFLIIFFVQILNGIIISLNTYYHSKDLEILFVSPINRTSLFFSKLIETHMKASWMLVIFGLPLLISIGTLYKAGLFYYFYALVLFIAFSTIVVNIGSGITIFISSIFEARKLKKVMISAGVIAIVLLITLLRFFRPERFVNPELFANMTLFISELKTPSFILFPNRWLSESIFDFLSKTISSNTVIFISLLFLTSYITALFLQIVFKKYHYRGWELLQGGDLRLQREAHKGAKGSLLLGIIKRCGTLFRPESSSLIQKEFIYYMRDAKNIHQSLVIFSLVIIYLFSITSLPLNWEDYAVQLKYAVSFFNLGLILIIIASLCSRIVYPTILAEAGPLWIIKTAPVTIRRFVLTKFFFLIIPIFILGQLLTVFSSFLLGIEKEFIVLKVITTGLLSFSLVSIAVAFGISDLKYAAADTSQEQIKTGSTAQMLVSVFLIVFTLVLEIIPVFLYFLREAQQAVLTSKAWLLIGGICLIVFVINAGIVLLLMRLSIRSFRKMQSL